MPALITHHIFGEDIARLLPEGIVDSEEELLAFLLGNQGPDPFFAAFFTLPRHASDCHRLARAMHESRVLAAFREVRTSVGHLPREDERIGRAFALGMLGHYTLDSTAHPFVFAEQYELAKETRLSDACSELHAIIESDLDTWVLWEKRGLTVTEAPAADDLLSTERIDRVAGAIFAQVALSVYGIGVRPEDYAGALRDYRWIFRRIDPAESDKTRLIAAVERLGRPHSMAASLAHRALESRDCPSANLGCRSWTNPFTGAVSHLSFADLYAEAAQRYPGLAESFARGDFDRLAEAMGGVNYDGCPSEQRLSMSASSPCS